MKNLFHYLESRPALKISVLEREAGMPARTIANAVSENDKGFPSKWVWPLVKALELYGCLEIQGWKYSTDEVPNIFISTNIKTGEQQVWDLPDLVSMVLNGS